MIKNLRNKKICTYVEVHIPVSRVLLLWNKIVNPQLRKSTAKFAVAQLNIVLRVLQTKSRP